MKFEVLETILTMSTVLSPDKYLNDFRLLYVCFFLLLSSPYTIHWRPRQFENCFNCFQDSVILVIEVEEIWYHQACDFSGFYRNYGFSGEKFSNFLC